jgi:DNA repair protein RecO
MSREQTYTAIILKKQAFGEADEIVTFFTKEAGKVRGLAKSVKFSRAKLQNNLQSLFLVDLTLAESRQLPKIIGVAAVEHFPFMRSNMDLINHALYATELVLKFTADEQKNEKLFNLLLEFLRHLENNNRYLDLALAKFKTQFLSAVGFSVIYNENLEQQQKEKCLALEAAAFSELNSSLGDLGGLQKLLSNFITFHLEREVKSERFLQDVV